MTNDATYREKGRALFLAAMMVLSVVAMSAAFAGAAAAHNHYDDGPTFDSDTDGIDVVWIGQEITLDSSNNDPADQFDGLVSIAEGPPDGESPDSTIDTDNAEGGVVTFETDDLEDGQYYHIYEHGSDNTEFHEETFQALSEDIDVEFDRDSVNQDGTVDISFESERDTDSQSVTYTDGGHSQDVNVSVEDINADDLENILEPNGNTLVESGDGVVIEDLGADETIVANFNGVDVDTGEYEFHFNVTDSLAEATATIEVTDDDEDRYFVSIDNPEQGDVANVTIGVDETDHAVVTLGDYDDDGHAAIIALENIEEDEIVLQYNTYAAEQSDAWTLYNESQADIAEEQGGAEIRFVETDLNGDPLPGHRWDLGIGSFDDGDYNHPLSSVEDVVDASEYDQYDRDIMIISDRTSPGDAVTQTAPEDDSVSDLDGYEDTTVTNTEIIAVDEDFDEGDSLFMHIEDFGANGSVEALGSSVSGENLYDNVGISIEIVEQDSGAVGTPTNWNSSYQYDDEGIDHDLPVEVYTLEDDYEGDLIIEILYLDGGIENFEIDETYDVYFNISEEYNDLFDENYSDSGELTFEEPELEWDEIDELEASEEATATGTTNIAPGSEIRTVADSPTDEGSFVETADANVTVSADGNVFTATFDLSDEEVGSLFDLEAETPFGDDDDTLEDVRLVEAEDDDDDDEDKPEEGLGLSVDYDDIEEGDTAEVDTTVDNHGENETTVDVVLEIDGETHEESLEIDGGDSASHTFAVENLSVGDYDFTVTVEDDEFDEEYDGTISVSEEGAPDDDDDDADAPEDDDDDDDDDDDGTPGFGVAVALVALLSAAMLALRRQD